MRKNTDNRTLRLRSGVTLTKATAIRNVMKWAQHGSAKGCGFYIAAYNICEDMAARHSVPVHVVAGVIAALSPQTPWDSNIKLAESYFAGRQLKGIPAIRIYKCNEILSAGVERVADILNGPKTVAFYWNILGDSERVTIDTHATYSCFFGPEIEVRHGEFLTPFKSGNPKAAQYRFLESVYKVAARKTGLEPSTLQARVWAAVRDRKGRNEHKVEVPF